MKHVACMTPHLFPSILKPGTWCCSDKMRVEEPEPGSREFLPPGGATVFRGSTPEAAYTAWWATVFRGSTPEAAYVAWYFAGEADGMGSN